jgi:predicted nucleotidyltransferase
MNIWERLAQTADRSRRRLLFVGWLTEQVKPYDLEPIVVGDHALEFYTLGDYATADIDLVCYDRATVGQVLEQAGFRREGRHWYRPDLDLAIEVPDDVLAGSRERVERVAIDEYNVCLIGKEDLLIDRLNACVHWGSEADCLWVKELMLLFDEVLAWSYLEQRAGEEGTLDKLMTLRRETGSD